MLFLCPQKISFHMAFPITLTRETEPMKIKYLLSIFLFSLCASTQAEWFLRGTHNAWDATQMISAGAGTNTMQLNNVVFSSAGSIKFDRFGDWSENYGVGGRNGGNISVAAGTWNIKFFTDTKSWAISSPASSANSSTSSSVGIRYHLRGTHNAWATGDFFIAVENSPTDFHICRNFTSGDAGGGPRFKVDPNGGWGSDAFPTADVAANGWTKIIINGGTRTLRSTTTNMSANCGASNISSVASTSSVSSSSKLASSSRLSSSSRVSSSYNSSAVTADDFRARTIYFMFVDRFANGNTNNDNGNNSAATSTVKSAGGLSEWKKYWGGDVAGIIAKLDYLESLGVSAIWVTPLMDNIDVGAEGGYHGYWAKDFYSVDEHLGDWDLIDELHRQMELRGMKLVLDIALNHSNQDDSFEFGTLLKEGAYVTNFANGKGTWYHNNGAISDCGDTNPATKCDGSNGTFNEWNDPWSFRNKSLFNLADFNHGVGANSQADNYLINAALKWMDHGVEAFRIDAIKHIEPGFINRFAAAVRAKKADTYIFGEWYDAGAGDTLSMSFLNERRGSELLDFKLRDNIEKAIAGDQSMISLSSHINSRAAAMNNNEDLQTIFLDNHDATRTSVFLQTTAKTNRGNGKGMSKAFADARQNVGMALVMTLPGIPTIYYGTEQNSTWFTANGDGVTGHDPFNREQMPSFSQTTPAFTMITALANLRKNSIAIQRGNYAERWVTEDVLVFQRQEGADCAVVALNRGAPVTVTVPNLCLATGAYTNKIGTDVVSVSTGMGTFTLSQNEVVVLH